MSKQRIGCIGVGLMGHGAAKCILGNGYPRTVMGHRNRAPVVMPALPGILAELNGCSIRGLDSGKTR